VIYWAAYYFFKMLGVIFFPRTILGKENLPRRGGFVIASNHLSNLDPFLIGLCLNRRMSYMAKDSLFRNPFLRFLFYNVEAFPVRREFSDVRALRETLRRLKRGLPIVMFPEGTRKGSGKEQKIHSGVGFVVAKGNVPVVPVCIEGSDKVLPPGARFPKRNRVTISFGKPLIFAKGQSYSDIATSVMMAIQYVSERCAEREREK
jgi:1-acyl-sn-glycerol-3-phosphate acyltransferase